MFDNYLLVKNELNTTDMIRRYFINMEFIIEGVISTSASPSVFLHSSTLKTTE